jgi:hypothetical protein
LINLFQFENCLCYDQDQGNKQDRGDHDQKNIIGGNYCSVGSDEFTYVRVIQAYMRHIMKRGCMIHWYYIASFCMI